jgi:hypothetical protein
MGRKCPRFESPRTVHTLNTVPWKIWVKVAVYKYHTNEFVYKSEGVGAIADWEGKLMMS